MRKRHLRQILQSSLRALPTPARWVRRIDLRSLRIQLLTATLLALIISVGGVLLWSHWRTSHILIDSHKRAAIALAERFEQDLSLYVDEMGLEAASQYVVDIRTTGNLLLWLMDDDDRMMAQSRSLGLPSMESTLTDQLMEWNQADPLTVQTIANRQWVICQMPIDVGGLYLGQLTVAEDITQIQNTIGALGETLIGAGIVMSVVTGGLLLWISRRCLRPLTELPKLTPVDLIRGRGDAALNHPPTEIKALLKAHQHLAAQLVDAQQQQQQLVKDISHELRTPLTLVQGYLQSTLRRSYQLSEPQREGLEIAATEAERTITLLKDLVDLARLDSGQIRLKIVPVDLEALVQEVVQQARGRAQRITIEMRVGSVWCEADQARLAQVIAHLIDNGLRYSPPDEPIQVQIWQDNHWAMVAVKDHGPGVSLIAQSKIFEPFYRVESDRSRSTGGSGLGLSISRALVIAMGGKIEVTSILNQGSTFTVMLPRS